MSHADGEQPSDEDEVRDIVGDIFRWLDLEFSVGCEMRDFPEDDLVDRLAEQLNPRRFQNPDFALDFYRLTSTLELCLAPRFPTLDFTPLAMICQYVLAWNLVGPDERYVPPDDVLDRVSEEAFEVLTRAVWDLVGLYKVGPLTFRQKEREIVFGAEALTAVVVQVDQATFLFALEVARGGGRPVPYSQIKARHPDVLLENATDQARKLRKAIPSLPLRGTRAGFFYDI